MNSYNWLKINNYTDKNKNDILPACEAGYIFAKNCEDKLNEIVLRFETSNSNRINKSSKLGKDVKSLASKMFQYVAYRKLEYILDKNFYMFNSDIEYLSEIMNDIQLGYVLNDFEKMKENMQKLINFYI